MIGQLIFDILCWFWVVNPFTMDQLKEKDEPAETQFVSINNNCSIDGCNAMRHEESIYCLRHVAFPPKAETEPEENWWGEEN